MSGRKADGELVRRLILVLRWLAFAGALGYACWLLLFMYAWHRYGSGPAGMEDIDRREFISIHWLAVSLLAAVLPGGGRRKYRMLLAVVCLLCSLAGALLMKWPYAGDAAWILILWLPLMALVRFRPALAAWWNSPTGHRL